MAGSFSDDFDQDTFSPHAVKFAVVDLFPGAEVQFAFGDGDNDFTSHDLALEVCIGVVFAGAVVVVVFRRGVERSQVFQPDSKVVEQSAFGIVDEDRGGDVHGVDQAESFLDAAFAHTFFHFAGEVDESFFIGTFNDNVFGQ